MRELRPLAAPFVLLLTLMTVDSPAREDRYFKIEVVDAETGRGVPLVELKTVNDVRYYTDSNGIVAFFEPGVMKRKVFFHVKSHGYEYRKDGFGYRGKALDVVPGGSAVLKIKRINFAERLYRVTGGGIYRDSVLLGKVAPIRRPTLSGLVFGSDSVVNAIYRGRIYWFWGDTNRPGYPLGNFDVSGATSALPDSGGLDPEAGVNFEYFIGDTGFAKKMAPVGGKGPTWIDGVVTLSDPSGRARLFAAYVKIEGFLKVYERGLVEFNDARQEFEKVAVFALDTPLHPYGHPLKHVDGGIEYVYFANPYPLVRVRADPDYLKRPSEYEAYTCLKEGTRIRDLEVDRAADGSIRYAWKKRTPWVHARDQATLIKRGKLQRAEALLQLQDVDTGKPVKAHAGSVYWNEYRGRWVMITEESEGTSYLGEVWYAEGDTLLGPWRYARKIITHEKYSFYNPKQQPMFDKENGRIIFVEGTYSNFLAGTKQPTPWYNYNQVMYKLDLADRRLALPVPVYQRDEEASASDFHSLHGLRAGQDARHVAFLALDRPGTSTVPVYLAEPREGSSRLEVGFPSGPEEERDRPAPLFHALPANVENSPSTTLPLYEFQSEDGAKRVYSTRPLPPRGYRKPGRPICRVWAGRNGVKKGRD